MNKGVIGRIRKKADASKSGFNEATNPSFIEHKKEIKLVLRRIKI